MADAPPMNGAVVVVTGANSGIGLETTRHLARLGARVVMACRNPASAETARVDVLGSVPDGDVSIVHVDLGDLASVRAAAKEIAATHPSVDVLINNAGVMAGQRELTADGFEMDFGTNFLGHFALTGLLLDVLAATGRGGRRSRIVTVGSKVSRAGVIDFDDLRMDRGFTPGKAYSRAKLAQTVFAIELQRRLAAAGVTSPLSVVAHPGATHSGVMREQRGLRWLFTTPSLRRVRRTFIMDGPEGALSSVRAATDPGVLGGQYYGPRGRGGLSGPPELTQLSPTVNDLDLARRLWDTAEELTGVEITLPAQSRG